MTPPLSTQNSTTGGDLAEGDQPPGRLPGGEHGRAPAASRPVRSAICATDASVIGVSTNPGQSALTVTPVVGQLGRGRPDQPQHAVLGGGPYAAM